MIRYSILMLFLLFPISVFAGADTDAICANDALQWIIYQNINVSYPGESVSVDTVYKLFYTLERDNSYNPKWEYKLYYAVNIKRRGSQFESRNARSELYEYNCTTKIPKKLVDLRIYGDWSSYYTVDYENDGNLLIAQKYFGASEGWTERIVGYNVYSKKKIFDLKWFSREWKIEGFADTKKNWYIYFASEDFISKGTIYQIQKHSKKIIKL